MSKQTSNVPALRFKEFSGEWETKTFGELLAFFSTNSFSRALLNYEVGEVKNIHYGDIHSNFNAQFKIQDENVPFVNPDVDLSKVKDESYCQVGDLVIADASEDYKDIGKSIEIIDLANEKLIAGLHTYIARDLSGATAIGFKGYLMQSSDIRLQIMKYATGISVLGISKGNLAKVNATLPALPEQQKIADFLSAVDEKIQQLTRKKELLEQYKKGVMQQLFSQQLRFQDDNGRDFPEWEEKRIEDIFQVTRGHVLSMSKITLQKDAEYNYPVYSSQTKNDGLAGYYSNYLYENSITWTTDGANAGEVNFRRGKFYCTNVCGVLVNNKGYSNECIAHILNTVAKKYVSYVGNPKLMNNVFSKINIWIPSSVNEQEKIANFLSAVDDKINQIGTQQAAAKAFKKGLLQQMFV